MGSKGFQSHITHLVKLMCVDSYRGSDLKYRVKSRIELILGVYKKVLIPSHIEIKLRFGIIKGSDSKLCHAADVLDNKGSNPTSHDNS